MGFSASASCASFEVVNLLLLSHRLVVFFTTYNCWLASALITIVTLLELHHAPHLLSSMSFVDWKLSHSAHAREISRKAFCLHRCWHKSSPLNSLESRVSWHYGFATPVDHKRDLSDKFFIRALRAYSELCARREGDAIGKLFLSSVPAAANELFSRHRD